MYGGVKRVCHEKYSRRAQQPRPELLAVRAEPHEPGAYRERSGEYVMDVPLGAVKIRYVDRFWAMYRGQLFRLGGVCYNTLEVRLEMGDDRRELQEAMEKIGVESWPREWGMHYRTHVPVSALEEIHRERYDYSTGKKVKQVISAEELRAVLKEEVFDLLV